MSETEERSCVCGLVAVFVCRNGFDLLFSLQVTSWANSPPASDMLLTDKTVRSRATPAQLCSEISQIQKSKVITPNTFYVLYSSGIRARIL